ALAREVLDGLGLAKAPPVLAGSTAPLADRKTPRLNPGVERIIAESRAGTRGQRVVVVAIGAVTDVASALLAEPGLADRVKVVAMGFARWPEGGDPWNVKNDIKAWQVLLDSAVPLVVGDEAVCARDLAVSVDSARRRLKAEGPGARRLIGDLE